jgi:hypothetical protein
MTKSCKCNDELLCFIKAKDFLESAITLSRRTLLHGVYVHPQFQAALSCVFISSEKLGCIFVYIVFLYCILCIKRVRRMQAGCSMLVCTRQKVIKLSCQFILDPYEYRFVLSSCEAKKWSRFTTFICNLFLWRVQHILMLQIWNSPCSSRCVHIMIPCLQKIVFFHWVACHKIDPSHGCHQELWPGRQKVCLHTEVQGILQHAGWKNRLKNGVFWDVTPCGSCKNRRFRRT